MAPFVYLAVVVLTALTAVIYSPVKRRVAIMGLTRHPSSWTNIHGIENRAVPDTIACEDLHHHTPSGMLYSACMGDMEKMSGWFPGAPCLDHPESPGRGTIEIIDPVTMKSQRLTLSGFEGPFVTHGIDVYNTPSDPSTVYIFAVNHLPNPRWFANPSTEPKAASRIELFVHTTGSNTAKHLRSISHPLIRTPNDLFALSEHEFLVTNDHHYRDGHKRVLLEDIARQKWTDVIHVSLEDDDQVVATVSLNSIATTNGLGRGPNQQILISNALGGALYFATLPPEKNKTLSISHSVQTERLIDNPSYFSDPYAGLDGKDYSGYLLAGFGRAVEFPEYFKDPTGRLPIPSVVQYLPASAGRNASESRGKQARVLFSDDSSSLRSATTAVLTAIDPATNDGKRQGWLFVTGVVAPHMLATKIDFESMLFE
ncbi:calcium-dependent phosphotriesterase [Xylariaceae sp. FL0662B]|nr:calcium-dependent phosphotriesterase [Xylariaceae sp. FL0662B]